MIAELKQRIKEIENENTLLEAENARLMARYERNNVKIEVYNEIIAELEANKTKAAPEGANAEPTPEGDNTVYNFETGM